MMHEPMRPVHVGTDGGAWPNPGPAGWGWVDDNGYYAAGSFANASVNQCELMALYHALVSHIDLPLVIEYDSQYAVNAVTVWEPRWRATDPSTLMSRPNINLIHAIQRVIAMRPAHLTLDWQWVAGHDKNNTYPLNTAADHLASVMRVRGHDHYEYGIIDINDAPDFTRQVSIEYNR